MSGGRNPIEKNVKVVDITAAFIKAAGQEKYNSLRNIVDYLKQKKYAKPVLYGGAFRDLFIGQQLPKDYDIEVQTIKLNGEFKSRLQQRISSKSRRIILDINQREKEHRYSPTVVKDRALRADAPINAVAMGTDGTILAHPQFMKHAQEGLYAIRGDLNDNQHSEAQKRFKRLANKYPNWSMM